MNFTTDNFNPRPFLLDKNATLSELNKELQSQFSQAITLITKTISKHFMEDAEEEHFYFFYCLSDLAKQTKLLYEALYNDPLPLTVLPCEKNVFILNKKHPRSYFYYQLYDKISQMITLTKLLDDLFFDIGSSDKNNTVSMVRSFLECGLEILEWLFVKFPENYEN